MLQKLQIENLKKLAAKGLVVEEIFSEASEFHFEVLKDLLNRGYISARYTPAQEGDCLQNVSITDLGYMALENAKPKWKSWENGWKKWLAIPALIATLVFTVLKIIEFISK